MRWLMAATLLSSIAPVATGQPPATTTRPAQPAAAGLDLRNVRLRLDAGKITGGFEYALLVGTFYEWNTDPTAVPGLMSEVTARTGVRARVNFSTVALDEPRIARNPLLIMTGNRFFHLTDAERANLRRYLLAGGFIYADDCGGADRSFREMIQALLPDAELAELDKSDPLFTSFYRLDGPPKVLDLYGGPPKAYGVHIGDRLAMLYTYDTDIPCGWEKNPDGSFVHLLNRDRHEASYQFGVNVVMHVLGELQKRRPGGQAVAGEAPATAPVATAGFLAGPARTYRMKPLMPCNLIRAIAPAGRYVWFGGRRMLPGEQEGLARYDYQTDSWELLLDSEGVLADEINCLAADERGLWIGTSTIRQRWNYGLWYYDPQVKRSRRYSTEDGLVDHDVYDLALTGDDLWVATRSGLAGYNRKTATWTRDPARHDTYVDLALCLAADERYVWFGRSNGLRRYDRRKDAYEDFDATNSPIRGMVNVLVEDGQRLWISAPPKMLIHQAGRFSTPPGVERIAASDVLTGAADQQVVCFGTRNGGLFVLDKAAGKWQVFNKASGLPSDCISRTAVDQRSIWCAFGSDSLGVGRYDRGSGKWAFYTYRAGIPCDHVYSLACDGKGLYVGTMANGFWKYDIQADRWVNLNLQHRAEHAPVRRCDVYCILRRGQTLWLGTNQGLSRHEMGSPTYEIIGGGTAAVAALAADGDHILCGTKQNGVLDYDPASGEWTDLNARHALHPGPVTALACEGGRIWIGTEDGLLLVDTSAAAPVPVPAELKDAEVLAILLEEGAAWVGTSRGLFKYRLDQRRLTRHGTDAALPGEPITALAPCPGGLLVGTRSGLALLSRESGRAAFDKQLADRLVSALVQDSDTLWIGTLGHGLVRARLPAGR